MDTPRYRILHTEMGLIISESRTSVLDVMEAAEAGDNLYAIAETFNLTPLQVETALAYIAEHRADLEPQLVQAQREKAEREAYYRRQAEAVQRRIEQLPMTPQRAALYARLAHLRREREASAGTDGSDDARPQ